MTCPECGTKIGVFRRKFSNTAYCSEACRETARQKQNQASLAVLLSNKKRHLALAQAGPAPPKAAELPPEPPTEPVREAVHSGALAGFAPFGRPNARQAPASVALLEEEPATAELRAGWQDAVWHAVRTGFGVTGWIVTAMSCLQPLVAATPAPCVEIIFPFTTARARASDALHPVWQPPAESEREPEPEVAPAPSRWIAPSLALTRLPQRWLGLSAASEFAYGVQWRRDRATPGRRGFAANAAWRPSLAFLPAGTAPLCAVDGAPVAFDRLPAVFLDSPLCARSPQPFQAASASGQSWRRQAVSNARAESPAAATQLPACWIRFDNGARAPGLGKLSAASWASVKEAALAGGGVVQMNPEAAPWRYAVRRTSGDRLPALPPDWNLLLPSVVESPVEVMPAVAIAPPIEIPAPPPARPSLSLRERLDGLRESIRGFPVWTRRLAFHMIWLVPLALGAAWFGPAIRAGSATALPGQWEAMKAAIQRRATIDLEDDFRAGLIHWNGAEGWAKSWSYDATGLLHPGMFAVYLESSGLRDYSVEFLAVIEKRALGWTYRTADMRNYYAAKLTLSRRGNIPTLDLERYAVIGGRQDRRVQLPLPVVLSTITSFRVRTEVRGLRFTTYLNGKIIDAWSDDRLTRGGVGFFAEPDAVVGLQWVRVIQGDDLVGRLCAQVSSAFADKKLREALH